MPAAEAIVFVGPSLPAALRPALPSLRQRPPIRRGDLASREVLGATAVAIIDGEFDQSLAVSPREILTLLRAGVTVLGCSSMGALRAAELAPFGLIGIGRIFEMFQRGEVSSDDEVAVCFDRDTGRALCEPLVNVRCSVATLRASGRIDERAAAAIVTSAVDLPYPDRTYRRILARCRERLGEDLSHLAPVLASHDQKRLDALELIGRITEVVP